MYARMHYPYTTKTVYVSPERGNLITSEFVTVRRRGISDKNNELALLSETDTDRTSACEPERNKALA